MSDAWAAVLVIGAGTAALKAVGPVGVAGRRVPERLDQLLEMLAPAILAALVVTETFGKGRSLVLDARLAGVAVGIAAIALRAPLGVVVIVGGAATALARLLS